MRGFLIRLSVAAVAIPVLLLLMRRGGWWLDALVALLILLAGYEVQRLAVRMGARFSPWLVTGFALVGALVIWPRGSSWWPVWLVGLAVSTVGTSVGRRDPRSVAFAVAVQGTAAVWLAIGFGALPALRRVDSGGGFVWLLFLFANLWLGDTAAYLFGVWLGRKPLAPLISPHKTITGAVAQILISLVVGFVFVLGGWIAAPAALLVLAALLIAVVGQLGDLFESAFKRVAGCKDSSTIIPGHGGVLDRFDSTLLAAPALWALLRLWPR